MKRSQILETPYKLKDVCPTHKMKSPKDLLRRIQKRIELTEKKAVESSDENAKVTNKHGLNLVRKESIQSVTTREADNRQWISEFRNRYKCEHVRNESYDKTTDSWLTASYFMGQIALRIKYTNITNTKYYNKI